MHYLPYVSCFTAGAAIAAACIYLTPLKWITVIEPTIKDIEPKEFYAEYKMNPDKFLFIDVRSPKEYAMSHATGSINIPLVEMYDARRTLPKIGKTIVLICTVERQSGIAYSYLQHYGFFNIVRIRGGMQNWVAEGLPVESSSVRTVSKSHGQMQLSAWNFVAHGIGDACPLAV